MEHKLWTLAFVLALLKTQLDVFQGKTKGDGTLGSQEGDPLSFMSSIKFTTEPHLPIRVSGNSFSCDTTRTPLPPITQQGDRFGWFKSQVPCRSQEPQIGAYLSHFRLREGEPALSLIALSCPSVRSALGPSWTSPEPSPTDGSPSALQTQPDYTVYNYICICVDICIYICMVSAKQFLDTRQDADQPILKMLKHI